jgi:hypothetical protein
MRERRVMTRQYDVAGNEIGRVARHWLLNTLIPAGNYAGGPGWRALFVCWVFHRFGRPLCRLGLAFEPQVRAFGAWVNRRAARKPT